MFDIGFSELLVIAVVALLVLGPERLPKAARFAGLWVRRARAQWHAVKSELENDLADEDMRRSIHRVQEELREAQAELQRDGERLRAQLRDVENQVNRPAGVLADDVGLHAGRARAAEDADAAPASAAPVALPPAAAPSASPSASQDRRDPSQQPVHPPGTAPVRHDGAPRDVD